MGNDGPVINEIFMDESCFEQDCYKWQRFTVWITGGRVLHMGEGEPYLTRVEEQGLQ